MKNSINTIREMVEYSHFLRNNIKPVEIKSIIVTDIDGDEHQEKIFNLN